MIRFQYFRFELVKKFRFELIDISKESNGQVLGIKQLPGA
jgi:hypothetical protein